MEPLRLKEGIAILIGLPSFFEIMRFAVEPDD